MANDAKKKILMLADHPLSTSGVGTQARWLITGLTATGKYSFRVFGGAIKHENYDEVVVNEDFIIKPTDGFGNRQMLYQALVQLRPDALFLFTDPRFFVWAFECEDAIHQICPIVYNHLWDNPPWPAFNHVLYESTDLINCINYPTYEMVSQRFPEKTNYIPHGVPEEIFRPLPQDAVDNFKRTVLKEHANDFIVLYVSRNARRKMPSDILVSWQMFINELKAKHGDAKVTMIMHTDPLDREGANLHHVIDMLGIKDHVIFSNDRAEFKEMVYLYNSCDTIINRSCAEGFGLGTLEAMMCGKPIIALKTGGLTRQVEDHRTGEQYGIALEPEVRCLTGNQLVPYIYEDFVSHRTVADAFMKIYEMGPEKRKELGMKALHHARTDYNLNNIITRWDETLTETIENWRDRYQRWSHVEL